MSDTPRTDANAGFVLDSTPVHCQSFDPTFDGSYVPVDFARELERENTKLRSVIARHIEKHRAIRWGWDGDCGSDNLVDSLEDFLANNTLSHDRRRAAP